MVDATIVQGPSPWAGRKRGTQSQAIGHSKGGMTTKILALTDAKTAKPAAAHAEATTAEATAKAAMSTAAAAERHGAGEPHWLRRNHVIR